MTFPSFFTGVSHQIDCLFLNRFEPWVGFADYIEAPSALYYLTIRVTALGTFK
ncbi:hypothetical protein VCHA27O13_150037 [Vibrio chagasii]|nr:hypothetical protein VCHA27O13_150037 [Vibrio chagasii]CAH6922719.1 hypothetical protein VCHA34P115_30343 [Vibrio chagasii]CAH6925946.1 hypothetical protein VCHA52P455_110071 [Vibrio chagasii]CAH7236396.1 hypothetical protein VCHA57P511_160132 [Vibrio chagasii]